MGFTKQELYIVWFLIGSLLVGGGVKIYKGHFRQPTVPRVRESFVEEFETRAARVNAGVRDTLSDDLNLKSGAAELAGSNSGRRPAVVESQTGAQDGPQPNQQFVSGSRLRIDINSASTAELQEIPKIGPVLAERIVSYREQKGRFRDIQDLLLVKGIGKKTLEKMEPFIALK